MRLEAQKRVAIERVTPQVDCGRFPIKRTIGERVIVRADIHADGHDLLDAVLLFRKAGASRWREVPMVPVDNDRWEGRFVVDELGRYEYCVEGWIDRFGSWRHEVEKKFAAGQAIGNELIEGAALVRDAARRADDRIPDGRPIEEVIPDSTEPEMLEALATVLEDAGTDESERVSAALSDELLELMGRYPDRMRSTRYDREL